MATDDIGGDIVRAQRAARFGDISTDEWAQRLKRLIEGQEGVAGDVEIADVRQVGTAAGGSNGTLLFSATYRGTSGIEKRNLVLRFLPVSGLFHRYDVLAQFNLQRALANAGAPVPRQMWMDEDGRFLERPGYVMEQVKGVSAPMTWMSSGLIATASPADRRKISLGYVEALARVHAVDWRREGLQWLERRASGSKPIERETNWYWDALEWSGSSEYLKRLAPVRAWLIDNEPSDVDTVVCHGDANFGNYMFNGTELTAVVDWEMSFLGAPECDLSYLAAGDAILQSGVEWPAGTLSYAEMRAEYEKLTGRKLQHMDYFELFSAYRIAVCNVLAMRHFPPEALANLMPLLERGPKQCLEHAHALGVDGA